MTEATAATTSEPRFALTGSAQNGAAETAPGARIELLGPLEIVVRSPAADFEERRAAMRDDDWALLALLSLSPGSRKAQRDLLVSLWPRRRFDKLLRGDDPDDHARDLTIDNGGGLEEIERGLQQLRNSATRLRHFLNSLGAPGDPVPADRSMPNEPASGSYRLELPSWLRIDAVDFVQLLSKRDRSDDDRLAAIRLVRGPVLQGLGHDGLKWPRSQVSRRVELALRMLLPDQDCIRLTREIVKYGAFERLEIQLRRVNVLLPGDSPTGASTDLHHDDLPFIDGSRVSVVAQATLRDLLIAWTASAAVRTPVENVIATTLPAQWGDVDSMRLDFLIFACDREPEPERDPVGGWPCLRYRLSDREIDDLREYVETEPRAYAILAVPRHPNESAAQLMDRAPHDRFQFFALDVVQYYRTRSEDDLLFPTANRLNLALFSLVWAARWVEDFFSPLAADPVRKLLDENIALVFNREPHLPTIMERGWDPLVRELPGARGYLDPEQYRRVAFRLGMGSAMQLINGQMLGSSRLTSVRTYCPEALYGTANLWLFSRTYHQFMGTTAQIQHGRRNFYNQRLLPVARDLAEGSRLYATSLWHVVLFYRMLRAEVRIVQKPAVLGAQDHGYYGGGIGQFQWIELDDDGGAWVEDQHDPSVQAEHLAFLNDNQDNVMVGPEMSEVDFAALCRMPLEQLRLATDRPKLLFPPEDEFIEHPSALWSRLVAPVRLRGIG